MGWVGALRSPQCRFVGKWDRIHMIIRKRTPRWIWSTFLLLEKERFHSIWWPRHCRMLCVEREVLISLQSCHLWQHIITYPSKTLIPHHSHSTTSLRNQRKGSQKSMKSTWGPSGEERRGEAAAKRSSTFHTRREGPVTFAFEDLSLVEKTETVQVHFHTRRRCRVYGLASKKWSWMEVYTDSNMANHTYCFMFHGLPKFTWGPLPRGRSDASSRRPCQWCSLWMIIKGPHNYMIKGLGSCVMRATWSWTWGPLTRDREWCAWSRTQRGSK